MPDKIERVVVLGASPHPERYANRAIRLLRQYGHDVVPVNPYYETIEGLPVAHELAEVAGPVDTVTLYVSEKISSAFTAALVRLKPGRVIFNPGAENPELRASLEKQGIYTLEACTLVLLNTGQF